MCAHRLAKPTYVWLFNIGHGGYCSDMPAAFKRPGCCLVPMTKQNRPPQRPRRRNEAADRLIIVARGCTKAAPHGAVERIESCEFCEHRSPPVARSRRPVSVRVSDRLDAIAYPHAADIAAIDLK